MDTSTGGTSPPPSDALAGGAPPAPHGEEHRRFAETVERLLGEHLTRVEHQLAGQLREVVSTGQHRLAGAVEAHAPAWLRPTRGESRWPVAAVMVVAIGLQLAVPRALAVPPRWLLPALELAVLLVLMVANPHRITGQRRWLRHASLAMLALASFANAYSAGRLIWRLVHGQEGENAGSLLTIGAAVWLTNIIIFALWYWEFDRGGPAARAQAVHRYPDFQFPQMVSPDSAHPDWEPTFADYLYLSFTNAAAFSPTDTMPMTRWAKLLMLTQAAISLATIALVIARAVNIFK